MCSVPLRLLAAVAVFVAVPAHAVTYDGTPVLKWRVDRPAGDFETGSVTLNKIRVHACGGGHTDVQIDDTFDPVLGGEVIIPSGNHCQVSFVWSSDLDIEGPSYVVRYEEVGTAVPLAVPIDPVSLTPYTVVSGSYSGVAPLLIVEID